jgi:hypothetical protein
MIGCCACVANRRTGHGADRGRLQLVREEARRLNETAQQRKAVDSEDVGRAAGAGLSRSHGPAAPWAAARYVLANGRGAFLPEEDRLAREPWLVVADLDGQAREAKSIWRRECRGPIWRTCWRPAIRSANSSAGMPPRNRYRRASSGCWGRWCWKTKPLASARRKAGEGRADAGHASMPGWQVLPWTDTCGSGRHGCG